MGWIYMDWFYLAQERGMKCFCNHGNETSVSVEFWKIPE
jgi:hypothetical protein